MKGPFEFFLTNFKKQLFVLCGIALLGVGYFGFQLRLDEILMLVPFLLLTIFYVLPIKWLSKSKKSLRTISGIKIFVIAFCWAGVTVLIPLIHLKVSFSWDLAGVFLQRLLFVLAITIPFDLRDLEYDEANLKTIPQMLGISKAKKFGLLLLMFFLGLSILLNSEDPYRLRIEFLIALISLLFLVRSSAQQHKYYSTFFVEAIPILWFVLVFITS